MFDFGYNLMKFACLDNLLVKNPLFLPDIERSYDNIKCRVL